MSELFRDSMTSGPIESPPIRISPDFKAALINGDTEWRSHSPVIFETPVPTTFLWPEWTKVDNLGSVVEWDASDTFDRSQSFSIAKIAGPSLLFIPCVQWDDAEQKWVAIDLDELFLPLIELSLLDSANELHPWDIEAICTNAAKLRYVLGYVGSDLIGRKIRRSLILPEPHEYCLSCRYYSRSHYLNCAVHPLGYQEGNLCPDWKAKL